MNADTIPDGMVEVTRDQFFATVGTMNVHPSNAHEEFTAWETPFREELGRSWPGWRNPGAPKRWAISEVLAS